MLWIELLLQGTAILFLIPVLVIFVQVLSAYLPPIQERVKAVASRQNCCFGTGS